MGYMSSTVYQTYRVDAVHRVKSVTRNLLLLWLAAAAGFLWLVASGSRASEIQGLGDFLLLFAIAAILTALPTLALWFLYRIVRFAFR
jgi:hypothetical protein